MTNDIVNKVLDIFVDALAERLIVNRAFTMTVATALPEIHRSPLDNENVDLALIVDKRFEDYKPRLIEAILVDLEAKIEEAAEKAVESEVGSLQIDADSIQGLDNEIESAVENVLDGRDPVDADDVSNLSEYISNYLHDNLSELIANDSDLQRHLKKSVLENLTLTVGVRVNDEDQDPIDVKVKAA